VCVCVCSSRVLVINWIGSRRASSSLFIPPRLADYDLQLAD